MTGNNIKHLKKNKEVDRNCLITIIMPIFNGASTLDDVLVSLEKQDNKDLIKEIVFINDNSTDNSREIIEKYQQKSAYTTRLIDNKANEGLAKNYNKGIGVCSSDYFILMHQDIILLENNCFENIIIPFSDNNVIAVFPGALHPFSVWQKYNFWQKCLFSRFVGKTILDLNGKFDCYDREKLIEHVGLFDEKIFRTAGEDGDMKRKINENGFEVVYSGFNVVHLHNKEANFNYKKIFKKEAQIAEAQGVLLRLYGINNLKDFLMSFFRPILLLLLFIPEVNILSLFLIIIYAFYYTGLVYIKEYRNFRILILPFINLCILPVATFYSIKGFLLKKQRI
jgi:glycosyltransferase involved in cell wall biosynthesis